MRVSALIEAATRGCALRALPRGGVCSGPAIHHGPCQGWVSRFTPRVIGQGPGARPGWSVVGWGWGLQVLIGHLVLIAYPICVCEISKH